MTTQIPKLRFPEFEGEWEVKTLGDFFSERSEFTDEQLPLYSLTIENGVVPKTERYERSHLVNDLEDAYKVMQKDDFAFNPMNLRFGALAKLKYDGKVLVSKYYNIFYCNDNANAGFMEAYLTSYNMLLYYNKMATGSLIEKKRVHYLDFIKFKKRLPTLPEQTKIANFLTAIDTKIQQLTQKKALLEAYKKGVMQQLFTQRIRFKDENGADYPDWEEKKLGEIVTVKSGKYNPEKDKTSYKCIELEHITSSTGQLLGFVDSINAGSIQNKFQKGDVLFGKLRPYLKKYLQAPFEGVCSSEIWVLKGRNVSNDFLYRIIQTDLFIELTSQSSGSKMPRADWSIVENGLFSIPSLPEQTKIANFLTAIDTKLETVAKQIGQTQAYKKGLLQQLFV
jgi:type I restriction enzyme S subunit